MTAETQQTGFLQPEVEKRYRQYLEDNHGDITDLPRICEVMFNAGGRNAILAMTQFADVLPLIGRIESRIVALRSLLERMTTEER